MFLVIMLFLLFFGPFIYGFYIMSVLILLSRFVVSIQWLILALEIV